MKYEVGQKVKIKSLDWYNENKDDNREIKFENGIFTTLKSTFLGQIMTIEEITSEKQYILKEDRYKTLWTDEMIEGLVEEETKPEPKFKVGEIVYSKTWQRDVIILDILPDDVYKVGDKHGLGWFKENEDNLLKEKITLPTDSQPFKQEISLPEGYQFVDENNNVINARKIVLEKKKKEYPKTYEECCKVMNYCCNPVATKTTHKEELIRRFQFLLLCRDAYWKIAGDWEPEFRFGKKKYCIMTKDNKVISATVEETNRIFVFPTPEMRDAFKENFKELIEQCKELL